MTAAASSFGNRFVATLPPDDAAQLRPWLQIVALQQGEVIVDFSQTVERVVFPLTALLGVFVAVEDGRTVQTLSVGDEGASSLLQAFGSHVSRERVAVQFGGFAYQVSTAKLKSLTGGSPTLAEHVSGFLQQSFTSAARATACAAMHTTRQRLCRWLLEAESRSHRSTLLVTQEELAVVLGVQRTTVTALAADLKRQGLISYRRGKVAITNPKAVAHSACDCRISMSAGTRPAELRACEPAAREGAVQRQGRLAHVEGREQRW